MRIFVLLFIMMLAVSGVHCSGGGAGASVLPQPPPPTPELVFTEISVSPNQDVHQGYTTDGTYHYLIDTARIFKRDANWNTVLSTTTPLDGVTGLNHLGDGDYYNGSLYVVGEHYANCTDFSHQSIIIFDAETLARKQVVDISAQAMEVSGLVVVPEENAIFVS